MKTIQPYSENIPRFKIKPIRVYFALGTDLNEENELERYGKYDENYKTDPAIQIICIVGKGVWFFYNEEDYDDDPTTFWEYYPSKGNHEELLILFGKIINQIISILSLGSLDMNRYLIDLNDEILLKKIIR